MLEFSRVLFFPRERWEEFVIKYSFNYLSTFLSLSNVFVEEKDHFLSSYCSQHCWRRRKPIKANKKSIFYSSDQVPKGHHPRLHSTKPCKETSTTNSSNKKIAHHHHHRRKRRHRSAHSKSHRRSSPERTQGETIESDLPSSALDMRSTSADEEEEQGENAEEEEAEDDAIDLLNHQLTQMNCQEEQDLCDDYDSLDEALDAELLDEENPIIASNPSLPPTNIQ